MRKTALGRFRRTELLAGDEGWVYSPSGPMFRSATRPPEQIVSVRAYAVCMWIFFALTCLSFLIRQAWVRFLGLKLFLNRKRQYLTSDCYRSTPSYVCLGICQPVRTHVGPMSPYLSISHLAVFSFRSTGLVYPL